MPEDLRQKIIESIAASADENYKQLLMLMLRVEEIFIDRVDTLTDQMTVPAKQHAEDHEWIQGARGVQGGIKSTLFKLSMSALDKVVMFAAGVLVSKLFV